MTLEYYIARKGRKYLALSVEGGVRWGARKDAFRFYTEDAAIQIACVFSSPEKLYIEKDYEEV